MNVRPKGWFLEDGDLRTIWGDDGALWVECEAFHPKSAVGRTVFVRFDAKDITKMIKELRAIAIHARSKPMGA